MPITLDVPESFALQLQAGEQIILADPENTPLALLTVTSVGMTKPGDVDHITRVKCYEQVLEKYPDCFSQASPVQGNQRSPKPYWPN